MDNLSKEQRSYCMSRIRGKGTKPEKIVRSLLHKLGFRFRLYKKCLPGTPDIVLPRYRTVIFVNGCFWHQHPGCLRSTIPLSNKEYWEPKLKKITENDEGNINKLINDGWKVLVIWECETKDKELLVQKINNNIMRLKVS